MKVRSGFVSNSSSSSFIIYKRHLSESQIQQILDPNNKGIGWEGDEWTLCEDEFTISGDTFMDNYSMADFFDKIGIPYEIILWDRN